MVVFLIASQYKQYIQKKHYQGDRNIKELLPPLVLQRYCLYFSLSSKSVLVHSRSTLFWRQMISTSKLNSPYTQVDNIHDYSWKYNKITEIHRVLPVLFSLAIPITYFASLQFFSPAASGGS